MIIVDSRFMCRLLCAGRTGAVRHPDEVWHRRGVASPMKFSVSSPASATRPTSRGCDAWRVYGRDGPMRRDVYAALHRRYGDLRDAVTTLPTREAWARCALF